MIDELWCIEDDTPAVSKSPYQPPFRADLR